MFRYLLFARKIRNYKENCLNIEYTTTGSIAPTCNCSSNGVCVNGVCQCNEGFTGDRCENEISVSSDTSSNRNIIYIGAGAGTLMESCKWTTGGGVFVLLAVVIVALLLLRRRKNNNQKGDIGDSIPMDNTIVKVLLSYFFKITEKPESIYNALPTDTKHATEKETMYGSIGVRTSMPPQGNS